LKFRTFKAIVIAMGVVVIGGGAYGLVRALSAPAPATATATRTEADPRTVAEPHAAAREAAPPADREERPTASDYRAAVLQASERTLSSDRIKDAFRGRSYKVNFYGDPGGGRVKRAKVDLDRDEKWDEKWTFDGEGGVKREVAPADDEQYTESYRLVAGKWVKK
jgi:hypothetical protein